MDAVGDGMESGVALRDGQGGARNVRRVNRRAREFLGDGDGDAAGAGADIGDLQAFAGEGFGWLAGGAACEERGEALGVRAGDLLFGMRVEPGALVAEDVEKQEFR